MKAAAFKELLESVREAGAYLKGNRKAVVRTNHIPPQRTASLTSPSPPRKKSAK